MKKFLSALLVIALLAGCASGKKEQGSSDKPTYKIGLHFELTGSVADYGSAELNGSKLAIKQANEKAGYEKYTIAQYDNKSDTTEAVTLATTLANDGVIGVVGPATSGASAATYQILNDSKIVVMSPSATANNVTLTNPDDATSAVYDYVFRTCFEDSYQGAAMAQFAVDTLNAKTAVIYSDSSTDYAKGLTTAFTNQFNKLGGTIVDTENYVSGDTDFNAVLTKISSMDFDVLYIPGYYNEAGLIIKQAKAMGIDATVIGPDGFDSSTLTDLAGADALNNVYFTTAYTAVGASGELEAFINSYKAEYSADPNMFSALAFDSTNALIQAIEEAEADGSVTGETVQAKMVALQFTGITGSFTYDSAHTPIKSVLIVEMVNGEQANAVSVSPKMD